MHDIHLREMTIDDHADLLALMRRTPGMRIRSADARAPVERYLRRNPGLSFVARRDGRLVGAAMAGHDGKRGYLQHVLVAPEYRRRGIATVLVGRCIDALRAQGIGKMHLDVLPDNAAAMAFWERLGWFRRDDLVRYSFIATDDDNA